MARKCTTHNMIEDPCKPSQTVRDIGFDPPINKHDVYIEATKGSSKTGGITFFEDEEFCKTLVEVVEVKIKSGTNKVDDTVSFKFNKNFINDNQTLGKKGIKTIFKEIYDIPNFYFVNGKDSIHAYKYRKTQNADGTDKEKNSLHAYGLAIDINGVHNPYGDAKANSHDNTQDKKVCGLCDSDKEIIHMRDGNHPVVKIFRDAGWGWGGKFQDYMHFSVSGN